MPPVYSGSLTTLRKADLIDILDQLGISPPPRPTKYDLTESIRAHLKSNPAVRTDRRFKGLWEHMPESRIDPDQLERSLASGEALDLSPDQERKAREHSTASAHSAGGSPRKSLDQLYHHQQQADDDEGGQGAPLISSYREAILNPHILDALLHPPASEAGLGALVPASDKTRSLRRRASTHLREAAHSGASALGEAQERLSDAWVVVVCVVVAELAWLTYEAVPWVDKTFGPHPYLLLPLPAAHYTFSLPVLSVLFHPTFLSALSLWILTTLFLPLLLATLFSFPSSSSSSSALSTGAPSPPNALIFSLARLALALLRGYVLPSPAAASPTASLAAGVETLTARLHEIAAGGPGALGLAGGRASFEGAVEGYWGVVAVGMAGAAGVAAYAEVR
ncbi:hypothetical protein JCM10207_001648 [Rhodosporidiobolus poonsookiae]